MALVFAHRGFSGIAPENTMLAFREAIVRQKADGIETDVQLSRDGVPMLIHDERVDRTTDHKGFVRDFTCAELQKMDARWKFGDSVPFQTIPTLAEFLDFMCEEKDFVSDIEMKTSIYDYPGLVEKVVGMVNERGLTDRVWYSSFNHYSMKAVKELCPEAVCGLLLECWIVGIGQYGNHVGADTINGFTSYFSEDIVREIHEHNMKALVWTPNETEEMVQLLNNGVDVLITNFPDRGQEAVKLAAGR